MAGNAGVPVDELLERFSPEAFDEHAALDRLESPTAVVELLLLIAFHVRNHDLPVKDMVDMDEIRRSVGLSDG